MHCINVVFIFYLIFSPSNEHPLEIIGCRDPFMDVLREIEDRDIL